MNIGSSYEKALLSEASYTDFQGIDILDADAVKTALITEGFSETQAQNFVNQWQVLAHQPDTSSGFSATLFKNVVTGRKTLAIRGTNDGVDWLTNYVDIGLIGSTGLQDQYRDLRSFYQQLITDRKLGANETFDVAGHSLGGFLAQSFAVDYASQVNETTTYNAPGFGGVVAPILRALGIYIYGGSSINVPNLTNLLAEAGPDFVAGRGTLLGSVERIFIEDQGSVLGALNNHRIGFLVDSLAVQSLLGSLDPNTTTEQLKPIFEAAAYKPEESLENILNDLSTLFGISGDVAVDKREALHARINAIQFFIQENALAGATRIVSVSSLSADATADTANGYAYRYALLNLNPFAISGNTGLYAAHNASGELNAANFSSEYLNDRAYMLEQLQSRNEQDASIIPTTDGALEYFDDRTSGIEAATFLMLGGVPDGAVRYTFGGNSAETITGGSQGDRLYGGAGNDIINGNAGDDYLEGGDGDDTLTGGAGRDVLAGGKGDDTYVYEEGDQSLTIRDSDGSGRIQVTINGTTQTLGSSAIEQVGDGSSAYEDDAGHRYILSDGQLTIALADGGTIAVEQFSAGDLGLSLDAYVAATDPSIGGTVFNVDVNNQPLSGGKTQEEYESAYGTYVDSYNLTQGAAPFWSSPNTRLGSNGSETINIFSTGKVSGGFVDSHIIGDVSNNYIIDDAYRIADFGDANGVIDYDAIPDLYGNDVISGGGGADYIFSGRGDDVLYGDDGDDYIFAGVPQSQIVVNWLDQNGRSSRDQLYGGNGDDTLVSHADNNYLQGDAGDDTLFGGAQNDTLIGGTGNDSLGGDIRLSQDPVVYSLSADGSGMEVSVNPRFTNEAVFYGDDLLDGGQGNDNLIGGGGNDILLGGDGNDLLSGDSGGFAMNVIDRNTGDSYLLPVDPIEIHGNDTLFGGAGDDALFGDGGDDQLYECLGSG